MRRPCKIYSWLIAEQHIRTLVVLCHPSILLHAESADLSGLVRFFCPGVPIEGGFGCVECSWNGIIIKEEQVMMLLT